MAILNNNIKWILIISGLITCSLIITVISPQTGLANIFGTSMQMTPMAEIVVRSWAVLITLTGGLLIYAAFKPEYRTVLLVTACISKSCFVALVLIYGAEFMGTAITSVIFDGLVVATLLSYLLTKKSAG